MEIKKKERGEQIN